MAPRQFATPWRNRAVRREAEFLKTIAIMRSRNLKPRSSI
jgi:hypothetical protein